MLETFFSSLVGIFEPTTFITMLIGIAIGFAVGILPGLGGSVTLALMLPFTFAMEPV
jgi:putative tricarboxylic transport membrane protein